MPLSPAAPPWAAQAHDRGGGGSQAGCRQARWPRQDLCGRAGGPRLWPRAPPHQCLQCAAAQRCRLGWHPCASTGTIRCEGAGRAGHRSPQTRGVPVHAPLRASRGRADAPCDAQRVRGGRGASTGIAEGTCTTAESRGGGAGEAADTVQPPRAAGERRRSGVRGPNGRGPAVRACAAGHPGLARGLPH